MSASAHPVFDPLWSADDLVAAVPLPLPRLHTIAFEPPANAAQFHRPSKRLMPSYRERSALPLFRIAN